MSEANINIRITTSEEEQGSPSQPNIQEANVDNPQKPKNSTKSMVGISMATGYAKQGLSMAMSHIAFETGNSHMQAQANAVSKIAEYGVLAFVNPYVALGKGLFDIAGSTINYNQRRWEEEKRIGRILGRSGSEINRSRK